VRYNGLVNLQRCCIICNTVVDVVGSYLSCARGHSTDTCAALRLRSAGESDRPDLRDFQSFGTRQKRPNRPFLFFRLSILGAQMAVKFAGNSQYLRYRPPTSFASTARKWTGLSRVGSSHNSGCEAGRHRVEPAGPYSSHSPVLGQALAAWRGPSVLGLGA
jgi:hypothetical protein